jgi:ABC-type transporter Mla subunit MlaD
VSSLWTPGGERPVARDQEDEPELTAEQEQLLDELQSARDQLSKTPASLLAAIHLDRDPPGLDDARLAIDALAALVEGLRGRLGEEEDALRDALAQLRLAFVEVSKRG